MRGIRGESGPASTVLLSAFDSNWIAVLEATLTVYDYYEELHPLIDSDEFRRAHGIRYLRGKIFDPDGALDQEFTNEYNEDGGYLHGRAVHADGTVIEN